MSNYGPPMQPPYPPQGGPGDSSMGYPPNQSPQGAPGYPQPQRSNVGLYLLIGGSVVIVLLIVVGVVLLIRGGGEEPASEAAPPPPEAGSDSPPDDGQQTGSQDDKDESADTEVGEPPHSLPEEQCDALGDAGEEIQADQTSTSATDTSARCSWDAMLDAEAVSSAILDVNYQLPYVDPNSDQEAQGIFDDELSWATDESGTFDTTVLENNEVEVGSQANLVFATRDSGLGETSVATLIIRQDNMVITVEMSAYPNWIDGEEDAPLEYGDIDELMVDLGAAAVSNLG